MAENSADTDSKLAIYLAVLFLVAVTGAVILPFYFGALGLVLWLVATISVLLVVVARHAANTTYCCPHCDHRFRITALVDLLHPHVPGKKWLRCPECRKRSLCPEGRPAPAPTGGAADVRIARTSHPPK